MYLASNPPRRNRKFSHAMLGQASPHSPPPSIFKAALFGKNSVDPNSGASHCKNRVDEEKHVSYFFCFTRIQMYLFVSQEVESSCTVYLFKSG